MAIYQIDAAPSFECNIYLVIGTTGAVLIDAGAGTAAAVQIAQIRRLLGSIPLRGILLTHCHADHCGGVPAFRAAFGCPVRIGAANLPPLREGNGRITSPLGLTPLPPIDAQPLAEGELFDLGPAHRLRVISTPGHTVGSVCFYDEVTRSLFAGDTVFGRTDFPTGSNTDMRRSLLKLINVNIGSLYPGHGTAVLQGAAEVEQANAMMDGL